MAFVFLQLSPIEFSHLPRRFVDLIFSMVLITLGLFINSLKDRYKNSYELAENGLLNLSKQINKIVQKEKLKNDIDEFNRIICKLNNLIY